MYVDDYVTGHPTKPPPRDSNNYSSLDRLKTNSVVPQKDTEYSELHHKTGRLQGPSRSPRGVHNQGNKEEYGQLDPSQVQSNSAGNNKSVKTSKKAIPHAGKAYMCVKRDM